MNMKSKRNGTSTQPVAGSAVEITAAELIVTLTDGRKIVTPLEWYPRLHQATPAQRAKWEWWGPHSAILWPEIDELLGIDEMPLGVPSVEYRPDSTHAAA
jgi:hypothetical protein